MKSSSVPEPSTCTNCGGVLEKRFARKYNRIDLVGVAVIGVPVIGVLAFSGLRKLAFLAAAAVVFGLYHFVGSRNVARWRCPSCGTNFDENQDGVVR